MKHLLLSLFVAFAVASCGKDGNNVSTNYSYTDPLTNPNLGNGTNWQLQSGLIQAKAALEGHDSTFGTGSVYTSSLYETSCKEKWKINWCSTSYNKNATTTPFKTLLAQTSNLYYIYSDGSYVQHTSVNVQDRINYLSQIFSRATNVYVGNYGSYKVFNVTVGSSESYVIDTRYPLQANPIRVQANGTYKDLASFQLL